jgi:hypothetical protein
MVDTPSTLCVYLSCGAQQQRRGGSNDGSDARNGDARGRRLHRRGPWARVLKKKRELEVLSLTTLIGCLRGNSVYLFSRVAILKGEKRRRPQVWRVDVR